MYDPRVDYRQGLARVHRQHQVACQTVAGTAWDDAQRRLRTGHCPSDFVDCAVASYGYNRESPLAGRFGGNLAGMAAIAGFGNGEIIEALVYHALYNLWHPGFARRA